MVLIEKMKKTSKGRQKIEIKEIEKISNRQVTFSKRRVGLFNKASELSVLCGAEIAIIVFSQAKKLYSFGHPMVDTVIDRYLTGLNTTSNLERSDNYPPVDELNKYYVEALKELEKEKKRAAKIEKAKKGGGRFWWDGPIDNMGLEELEQHMQAMEELREMVAKRYDELLLMMSTTASLSPAFANHVGLGDHLINKTQNGTSSIVPYGLISFGSACGQF